MNEESIRSLLNIQASESLKLRYTFFVVICLIAISLNYRNLDPLLTYSYIPAIACISCSTLALHHLKLAFFSKNARFLVDICSFMVLQGAVSTTIIANLEHVAIFTAPLEISLVCSLPLAFHRLTNAITRNIIYIFSAVIVLLVFQIYLKVPLLTRSLFMQLLVGGSAGLYFSILIIRKIITDNQLRLLLSAEREIFYLELSSRFFPHQISMISEGYHVNQTLPVGIQKAICLKFDIVASTKLTHPMRENIFERIFEDVEQYLTRDLTIIKQNPIQIKGKGFIAATAGDAVFVCFGYPFENDYFLNPSLLMQEIKSVLKIFDLGFKKFFTEKVCLCISIVYEPIRCAFATRRKIYSITGPGIFLAERYENLRKRFVQIESIAKKGNHVMILQNKAYDLMEGSLDGLVADKYTFNQQRDEKHVRDDPQGDSFYVIHLRE